MTTDLARHANLAARSGLAQTSHRPSDQIVRSGRFALFKGRDRWTRARLTMKAARLLGPFRPGMCSIKRVLAAIESLPLHTVEEVSEGGAILAAITGHKTQSGMITDTPNGFVPPEALLRKTCSRHEAYIQCR